MSRALCEALGTEKEDRSPALTELHPREEGRQYTSMLAFQKILRARKKWPEGKGPERNRTEEAGMGGCLEKVLREDHN